MWIKILNIFQKMFTSRQVCCVAMWYWILERSRNVKLFIVNTNTDSYKTVNYIWFGTCSIAHLQKIKESHSKMYFKLSLLLLLWFDWVSLSILMLIVNMVVNKFHGKIFSIFCSNLTNNYNAMADSFKVELFQELNDMKKGDKISVLEIGAGPGANFKYYNRNMSLQVRSNFFTFTWGGDDSRRRGMDVREEQ